MSFEGRSVARLFAGDRRSDRVVPKIGLTSWLTVLVSAAMAFLAVFALALAFTTERIAQAWSDDLQRAATVRVSGLEDELDHNTATVVQILQRTPGVTSARVLTEDEQKTLLEPWLGATLDLSKLPVPRLIEIVIDDLTLDRAALVRALSEAVPGAQMDDHARWRAPLVDAATRVRLLGTGALILIAGVMAALVTLAARTALSANKQVLEVLRLLGARDAFVARAFVRRVALRSMAGAVVGVFAGLFVVVIIPDTTQGTGLMAGFGFSGAQWIWPMLMIPATGVIAVVATRAAAFAMLKRIA